MGKTDPIQARILVVDDEPANVRLLERMLAEGGYRQVKSTTDSRQVLALAGAFEPDLILLDLMMPHLDGIAVIQQLRIPEDVFLPILVLTADATSEAKKHALEAGAKDFLTKPFDRLEVMLRIRNLLDTRSLYLDLERHNRSLEQVIAERTQRLIQSEKVATMGSLLAGVAHELNNPLAIVMGQAHLLRGSAREPALIQRAEKILAGADRCARIVRETVELLGYDLRTSNVDVVLDLADDVSSTWADGHQMQQVVVNLVANAIQAMRPIETPRRLVLTTRLEREPARISLEVADSGPGIPLEVQGRIFEPFFTTKPQGEGTGLGLSLCRRTLEEHDGTITVESEVGHGATFRLELPVVARPAPTAEAAAPASLPPVAGKAILVVDDEVDLAATLSEALQEDGYQVGVADNGEAALDMLGKRSYDMILSDTKMPKLDGEHFYAEIERRFPRLRRRIVFVTGDILSREKREFLQRIGAPHLLKPFDLREVRQLVHRILADAGPEGTSGLH